jgi:hypothetical protein
MARWASYTDGLTELEIEKKGFNGQLEVVTDSEATELSSDSASSSLQRQLKKTLDALVEAGVKVWLIKPIPETNSLNTARHVFYDRYYPKWNSMEQYTVGRERHLQRQAIFNRALESVVPPEVTVIDPSDKFYNKQGRLEVYSERSHYRDDDHLTRYGAERFFSSIIKKIFIEIRNR